MTLKENILAVYHNENIRQIPYMLDLSHWFYHKHHLSWDLSVAYDRPEYKLIDYHKKEDIGFYMPNLGSFYLVSYPEDVNMSTEKSECGKEITWRVETPKGSISRTRVWEEATYAWGIKSWSIQNADQLEVLAYSLENRSFEFIPEKYNEWVNYIGDSGVCYVGSGYSGMGQLLNYWMGIENTMYATIDFPEVLGDVIKRINDNNLELIKVLSASDVDIVVMGDNFSSDIQSPGFYEKWSKDYYDRAIEILHGAGKYVAVHIDGKLGGSLEMIRDSGADCADAVTPKPMGDLTPQQCRERAGNDFILSGGVSPDLWLPEVDVDVFKKAALEWIELKERSGRLIANAGDQVPPGADEDRIKIMRDLVGKHGKL